VLKRGGRVCFTVPVIVGRLTRTRELLPPSYHGTEAGREWLVQTEYGADVWRQVIEAGFSSCKLVAFDFPAGVAVEARRS
jgi:hypothetical protein